MTLEVQSQLEIQKNRINDLQEIFNIDYESLSFSEIEKYSEDLINRVEGVKELQDAMSQSLIENLKQAEEDFVKMIKQN